MPNHLASALSPYLRQHAGNPVDWYPWGQEALGKACRENKPIFLSIGYSACHWCHVMAHESFENPDTAAFLNAHFVSIKVDREERPDLDGLFMSVVAALTGQGGWPLSVFLTPELSPFYGGTYFPPTARYGLPGFQELLEALVTAWENRREEIQQESARLTRQLVEQSVPLLEEGAFDAAGLQAATHSLLQSYDWQNGGWGSAPKFPQPMLIEFLLRRHLGGDAQALEPALHALHAMRRGGMYDVVGGGFARYSTDAAWRVPHFEKMLYDNAQLIRVYLHAWQITCEPSFRQVVEQSLEFIARELTSPEGGFYSSLDADSDGEEGKFYTWRVDEVRSRLGERAEFFETAYGITAAGNWEGCTVLQRQVDDAGLMAHFGLTQAQVQEQLAECHSRLLTARAGRVRPATDDKILTAWNGLMLESLAEAGAAFGNTGLLRLAARNAHFLLTSLSPGGSLRHAWRNGQTSREVFLEDYAALILGLLALYQADFNLRWFQHADQLATQMLERFSDPQGGFFDTPSDAETVLMRPKEMQDTATPCGNAQATLALLKLAALTGKEEYLARAEGCLPLASPLFLHYPAAGGAWLSAADFAQGTVKQVAIVGEPADQRTRALVARVRESYRPNTLMAVSAWPLPPNSPALLEQRPMHTGVPTAYVCTGFVCNLPVTRPEELARQLAENTTHS
ncbi:MAG: thioredoxin domain-containing protein [Anaerolineales bacterium]